MKETGAREERRGRSFQWERTREGYVAEWPGILVLRVTAEGDIREIIAAPGAPASAVEKIRGGAVIAFVRAIAGKSSLHASAVTRDETALLFLGPSGAGKSSLAKVFCDSAGSSLLADDITLVDEIAGLWHASPSETSVWLHARTDAGAGTKVATPCAAAASPAPVVWVAQLSFDDKLEKPHVRPLEGAAKGVAFLSALVGLDPEPTPASIRRELAWAASISEKTRVVEVVRSRRVSAEATARAILNFTANPGTPV